MQEGWGGAGWTAGRSAGHTLGGAVHGGTWRYMAVQRGGGATKASLQSSCHCFLPTAPPIHSAQAVQRSVSLCLPPLIQPMATDREYVEALVARLLAMLTKGATYGERWGRGGRWGILTKGATYRAGEVRG